jgi:hypothetical protein
MTTPSPLTEAEPRSLDEYFARKPPYDATTLAAIKTEFRRLRAKFGETEAAGGSVRAKKVGKPKAALEVTMDIFGAEDTPKS